MFAVSGNRCYFPKCNTSLVDKESGKVTSRICHIKGNRPKSLRYDPKQSDEERHGFDNLILMCPIHHDLIDDDSDSVSRLNEIKTEHEKIHSKGEEPSNEIINQSIQNLNKASLIYSKNQKGGQIAHSIFNIGYDDQDSSIRNHIKSKNRLQNIFNDIKEELEKIRITDYRLVSQGNTDYNFVLKNSWDDEISDRANLKLFQDQFYDYIRSIKEDWQYFGIDGIISCLDSADKI